MKYIIFIFVLLIATTAVFLSCKKYVDTKATADPRLTGHYCNDPDAVNYNWGFPGVPDNTVCFYPTDVFQGVYEFHDSVLFKSTGFFVASDTFVITITKTSNSKTKFTIGGFCASGGLLNLTAGVNFYATLDTTMGDSVTQISGQAFCTPMDTVNGSLIKDRLNDSLLYITLQVAADTGVTTIHNGTAHLKYKL